MCRPRLTLATNNMSLLVTFWVPLLVSGVAATLFAPIWNIYMRLRMILSETPWDVRCPHCSHTIVDVYAELFIPADGAMLAKGRASTLCPSCNEPMRFPRGLMSNPIVADLETPVVYRSKALWATWTPERQQEAISRVPNIQQLLH